MEAFNRGISADVDIKPQHVAAAAEQQAQVAGEVDRNLSSIRDLSTQSASGARQTTVASNALSVLATDLNTMVQRFVL